MKKNNLKRNEFLDEFAKNELSSFMKSCSEGKKTDITMIVYQFLDRLGEYHPYIEYLSREFWEKHKEELSVKLTYVSVGVVIYEMTQVGCSQRQAFKAFSGWFGVSERQVANKFYRYREEFIGDTPPTKEALDSLFYFKSLPFFLSYDSEEDGGKQNFRNPVKPTKMISKNFPEGYPQAKKAFEAVYKKFLKSYEDFKKLRKKPIS